MSVAVGGLTRPHHHSEYDIKTELTAKGVKNAAQLLRRREYHAIASVQGFRRQNTEEGKNIGKVQII